MCSVKEANNRTCDYHRQNAVEMHFIHNVWGNRMCPSGCKGKKMFFNSFGLLGQILSGSPAEILYFTRQFTIPRLSSRNIVTRMASSLCLGKSSVIKFFFFRLLQAQNFM